MGFSILVVDDDTDTLGLFEEMLDSPDYRVDSAATGKEALKKLKEKHYDLVITDIRMPGIGGMDILKEVSLNHRKTRSIAITGFSSEKNLFDCMDLDCFGYVDKPFECEYMKDMKELIRSALARP